MSILSILAQTSVPATNQVDPPWFMNPFLPIIALLVVFYLFMMRGKRSTERKRTDMLAQLKKGDRIQTIGGILGTVVEARESEVVVKVDETSNVKMRFSRSAIHRVVADEGDARK